MSKIKLYIAVPSTGTVADAQSYFFRKSEAAYGDRIEFIYPKQCVHRKFHDFARNAHVDEFLASDAEILFFLDSDVVPPDDLFDLVLNHDKWKLAGAPYPVFMTPGGFDRPQILLTAYKRDGKGLHASQVPASGQEEVAGLATGCMFIKREVFSKLAKPYFEHKYDAATRMLTEGEDLGFCRKVNDAGYNFLVDYSMVCKHYKHVCLLEMNNYAMEYARRSVEQYAAAIKPALDALTERLKQKNNSKPSGLVAADGSALKRIISERRV